jgi:hypothetical protein
MTRRRRDSRDGANLARDAPVPRLLTDAHLRCNADALWIHLITAI